MDKATRERFERLEAIVSDTANTLNQFVKATERYVAGADARMTRIEETLRVLLDAITRERRNGVDRP